MPTYEYVRLDGTRFDIIQKMSDKTLTHCPETGQTVKRVISGGSGVIYKGTGFYNTDYKPRQKDPAEPAKAAPAAEVKPAKEDKA